jgi:hypothetical protein
MIKIKRFILINSHQGDKSLVSLLDNAQPYEDMVRLKHNQEATLNDYPLFDNKEDLDHFFCIFQEL